VQEKQLTTLGGTIHAIEINGNFDDCQQMVKQAFTDTTLTDNLFLTSANSINVARWLPQQFYYFFAYKQMLEQGISKLPPVIAVPSGNFGNICAGILAHVNGLPVHHFIAACNQNDVVPHYMDTKEYLPKKAIATISNAMDVGNPSNFVRILQLFNQQFEALQQKMSSVSVNDDDTCKTLLQVYQQYGYLLDPHGAVGYYALESYLRQNPGHTGILLETAHPVKFYDVVEPVIGSQVPIPPAIEACLQQEKIATVMDANHQQLKEYLLALR
jgi:threonine synthase